MFKRILIANDGSDEAYLAFEKAMEIAKKLKAELHMIVVEEFPLYGDMEATIMVLDSIKEQNEAIAERCQVVAKNRKIKLTTHVVQGFAVTTISDFAKQYNFDLLVMGFMEHCAIYRWLVGSTTDGLINWAPCSVLVVKQTTDEKPVGG